MTAKHARTYEFGEYTLNCASRTLRDGRGSFVQISAQAFSALVYLIHHAGRVVDRDELMTELWPNTVVEDNSLNRVILLIRRALGDGYVVTIKGRGYQFVMDVRVHELDETKFTNVAERKSGRNDGLARVRLGMVASICIILLIAAFAMFWNTAPRSSDPITRSAEARTENERAQQFYLSGRSYETMQYDADPDLAIRQYQRAVDEDPTFALAWARLSIAHNEKYWFRRDVSAARQQLARDAAMRAVELDPGLPEARMALGWYYYHIKQDKERAIAELDRAAAYMPENAEVYWRAGIILRRYGDIRNAIAAFSQAAELEPLAADHLFAQAELSIFLRDYSAAEENLDEILELQPAHISSLSYKAMIPLYRDGDTSALESAAGDTRFARRNSWALPQPVLGWTASIYSRDYEQALTYLDGWDEPAATVYHFLSREGLFGLTYELAGQSTEALPHWRAALAYVEGVLDQNSDFPEARMARAEALVRLGQKDEAVDEVRRIIGEFQAVGDRMSEAEHRHDAILRVLVPAGYFDLAVAELDTYLASHGNWSIMGMIGDPRLDPIRDDPRFKDLVARYR